MEWWVILLIVFGVILGAVFLYFFHMFLVAFILFEILFVRTKKEKWSRTVSWDDEEQRQMFAQGKKWGEDNEEYRKTITITNEGFKLIAEYFDFGFKKTVIIIAGRMESGTYSYYFSDAYKRSGYNVLAIDNRSHGLSEGRYNTIGLREHRDILAWARYIHNECGVEKVLIHGLCIGSATGLYALTSKNCPDYMEGLIADGMYVRFKESMDNHLRERKKPVFPISNMIMWLIGLMGGNNPNTFAPINEMKKMHLPMLFIYSKEDTYSLPEKGQQLFDLCPSKKKRIVFFDHGAHSHVRINAPEKYDQTIMDFIKDMINE